MEVKITRRMRDGAAYTALSRARTLDSVRVVLDEGEDAAAVFERAFQTSEAALPFVLEPSVEDVPPAGGVSARQAAAET